MNDTLIGNLSTRATEKEAEERREALRARVEMLFTIITTVALAVGFFGGFFGMPEEVRTALYIVAYLTGGFFGTVEGVKALRRGEINVDFLMVLAAIGAATLGQWLEGATLLFLFSLSNTLQSYALGRSRNAIRALMDLRPPEATRLRADGSQEIVPIEALAIGDTILVKPGERLAVDGRVLSGSSAIDQSAITGESIPVTRSVGDDVFAGTVNGKGALEVRMTKGVEDTTLAKIILMVEQAHENKAPTQRFLDDFEPTYAKGVIAAVALAIVVPYFLLNHEWAPTFYRAMTLLVVASPCALVISTPSSILSAIANAARNGILVKGGAYLEQLASIEAVALDKTGTLTVGKPSVTDIVTAPELLGEAWFDERALGRLQPGGPVSPAAVSTEALLHLVASVERLSEHPLADAIVREAEARGITEFAEVRELQSVTGSGVVAYVDGEEIRVGNQRLFTMAKQIWPEPMRARARELEAEGKTVIGVSRGNRPLGFLALADTVRPQAKGSIDRLRALGVKRLIMLTGDSRRVAEAVAAEVGVDEVHSSLLPDQKVELMRRLAGQTNVAMIGDGVNDAPALASANVGVAMGGAGSDVALESADVVLMGDDLSKLPYAIDLSRRARSIVRQNITFSLSVIAVLVVSTFLIDLPLPLGVVGHEGSTLVVVANALRLLRTPGQ